MVNFSHSACEIRLVYCVNSGSTTCFFRSRNLFSFPYHWEWTPALLTENWWRTELLASAQLLHSGGVVCHSLVCIRPRWSNSGLLAHWFCSSSYKILSVFLFVGSQPSHLADQGQAQQLTDGLGQKLLEPEAVESPPPAQPAKEMRALPKCFLNYLCSEIIDWKPQLCCCFYKASQVVETVFSPPPRFPGLMKVLTVGIKNQYAARCGVSKATVNLTL